MIYLDNAATTKIDNRVLTAMMPYLKGDYGNPGTQYSIGRRAAQAVNTARDQVASFFCCERRQIIFTSGGSESNSMVFTGLKDHLKSKGKTHIITSQIEHDSVLKSVEYLEQYEGFTVTRIKPTPYGVIELRAVSEAFTDETGLVSIMLANNETGAYTWADEVGKYCHKNGVLFHTDAVQAVGSCQWDYKTFCDFASVSGHKIHAPKGVGCLFVKNPVYIKSMIHGGSLQECGLRAGTENVASIVGFGKACEIMEQEPSSRVIPMMCRSAFIEQLKKSLSKAGLCDIIMLYGYGCKTVNMIVNGIDSETLLLMLDSYGICASSGSACREHESLPNKTLIALGISRRDARSSIRVSFSKMNTTDEAKEAAKCFVTCIKNIMQM